MRIQVDDIFPPLQSQYLIYTLILMRSIIPRPSVFAVSCSCAVTEAACAGVGDLLQDCLGGGRRLGNSESAL